MRIHLPVFVCSFHGRQRVALVVLAVCAVVNHAREHVNIPEYTDLGNQSATNVDENIRYIHTYIRGLLSRSMWGSLKLVPIIVCVYITCMSVTQAHLTLSYRRGKLLLKLDLCKCPKFVYNGHAADF